ncbi:MAG: right-handed parallel beta-helix repeat-containing protein [Parcubacteria group bacterium]
MARNSEAATYYVKNGGNDSLSGLDDASAWETIAKVQLTVTSGDMVYFNSGDIWEFSTAPFLTAERGVSYIGNEWPSAGVKAELKGITGLEADTHRLVVINESDVVFKGFEVDGSSMGTGGGLYVGYGAGKAIDNITVKDCYIHHTGNPNLVGGNHSITDPNILNETWQPNWQYGLYAAGGDDNITHTNFNIINNEVAYTYHEGVAIYTAWVRTNPRVDGVSVRGNNVHDCGTRPTYTNANGTYGNGGVGVLVANNADNVTVEFNSIRDNGMTGIWERTSPEAAAGSPDNLIIRNNLIYENTGSGFSTQIGLVHSLNANIYSNIFYNNAGIDLEVSNGEYEASTFDIYNNTIYNTVSATSYGIVSFFQYSNAMANYPIVNFKNNIIYSNNAIGVYDHLTKITAHSNNLIYRASGSTGAAISNMSYAEVIPETEVTVSNDATYTYFTKSGGTDWTTIFTHYNFFKWSGFTTPALNNIVFMVDAVTENQLRVAKTSIPYTDINIVTGVKGTMTNFNRSAVATWEPTAQNTDPEFTVGTLPTGFTGTYGINLLPNTNYFATTTGPTIDTGATLGSPFNSSINSAGLASPFLRPQGGAYDIGAYELQGADTVPPSVPGGLAVE